MDSRIRGNDGLTLRGLALVVGALAAPIGHAACLVVSTATEVTVLDRVPLDAHDAAFTITYVHSVTRSPIEERYVVDGERIVQTEIRFTQHGPGLPTAPDAGGSFETRDGWLIVRGHRDFDRIVMRVHADQSPRLLAGTAAIDLARNGNRAIQLTATPTECAVT